MNRPASLAILTGFIMGAGFGLGLEMSFTLLYNPFCRGQGCTILNFTWWHLAPLPLLLGIGMARAILHLPLGD